MKKWAILSILFTVLVLLMPSYKVFVKDPMDLYRPYLLSELENSISSLEKLNTSGGNKKEMQKQYHEARKHYKHVEVFVEYFSAFDAKFFINGPLVPKADPEYGNKVFYPNGFQVIEEMLFSDESINETDLIKYSNELILALNKLKIEYAHIRVKNEQLLEMLQYELYRITSLNLNGYDATISLTGLQETIWCIEGMEEIIKSFASFKKLNKESKQYYDLAFIQTKNTKFHLSTRSSYFQLHRLLFVTEYINDLNRTIVRFHNATKIPWTTTRKALSLNNEYLFGEESFDMNFFSIGYNDTVNLDLKAAIGKQLFFDPVLSGNLQRSCGSCHDPSMGFSDGFPKSMAMNGVDVVLRNAPTLTNVVFQKAFFYDGHSLLLEQQIIDVIHNPIEMGGNLDNIAKTIKKEGKYDQLFEQAFKGSKDAEITPYSIIVCLSEYEKTLISLNSRFDQFVRGEYKALTSREIDGYNLFAGKALCGSCHFFPIFNGTVPPFYYDTEFEILGTPIDATNQMLDPDIGRYKVTQLEIHKHSFKTPTVRNVELTGPYMHNGIYKTLDEVVEFYHKGGGVGLGYEVPNQTLPFDSLQLTTREKEDIVLFLKCLTDTTSYR